MTFLAYITKEAPEACGVHPAFGEVARLVFESEKDGGNPSFAADAFDDTRARAELALPYHATDIIMREHIVDVVELAICTHRQTEHKENHADRIALLKERPMSSEELDMATRDWWQA